MVAGRRSSGGEAEHVSAVEFHAEDGDGVFELSLFAEMKLGATGGGGEGGKRIDACGDGSGAGEDGDEACEIGTGDEAAAIVARREAVEREGIGDKILAGLGEGESAD